MLNGLLWKSKELFLEEGTEAQTGRHVGKVVWRCIGHIQHARRGLTPMISAAVSDEEGEICHTSEMQRWRWRRHFKKILNIQSVFG